MSGLKHNTTYEGSYPVIDLLLDGVIALEIGFGRSELDIALATANQRLLSGDSKKALEIYAFLVFLQPLEVEYQCGLANCAIQLREYEIALYASSSIVGLAPLDCRGFYFSAAACLGLGLLDEAREDIAYALALAKNESDKSFYEASHRLDHYLNSGIE